VRSRLYIGELPDIEPFHVADYPQGAESCGYALSGSDIAGSIEADGEAALGGNPHVVGPAHRRQVLAINPAVRGPKHVVKRGKTPVATEEQARHLLESIKVVKKVTSADGSELVSHKLIPPRLRVGANPGAPVVQFGFARKTIILPNVYWT
jgi:hypothetical protein